jgi:glycosyltransferase involved in cell wall biosynthesis
MRILYDGIIYSEQATGGVNRYFANLIARLPSDITPYLTTAQTREVNFPTHPALKVFRYRRFRPAGLSYRLEKYFFDYIARSHAFDVAHPTYYNLLTRRQVSEYRCPVVITVWDMIHELFPTDAATERMIIEKRKAVEAASLIICISENTKKDLLERYPLLEDKVRVTHLASEIDASLANGPELVPSRPYFMYVGLRPGYKNFDRLLQAFARVRSLRPDAALCVVGAPFNEMEVKALDNLNVADGIEHYGYVTDAHLARLYSRSLAFVYPSLYEGFGIPPLEAMSCGTPVVASNRSSIPEVVGDAGILFDPTSTDDLTDILLLLFDDEDRRRQLIAKGYERARLFSWDKTAAGTVEIYRSINGAGR